MLGYRPTYLLRQGIEELENTAHPQFRYIIFRLALEVSNHIHPLMLKYTSKLFLPIYSSSSSANTILPAADTTNINTHIPRIYIPFTLHTYILIPTTTSKIICLPACLSACLDARSVLSSSAPTPTTPPAGFDAEPGASPRMPPRPATAASAIWDETRRKSAAVWPRAHPPAGRGAEGAGRKKDDKGTGALIREGRGLEFVLQVE